MTNETKPTIIEQRKLEHVQIVLEKNVEYKNKSTGFEKIDFEHNALPELNFDEIDISTNFLGTKLQAPFMITGITGGYGPAQKINGDLAAACEKEGVVVGLGSMRPLFEQPELAKTYNVRDRAKKVFLCGNIGGYQLKSMNIDNMHKVLCELQANALCVHLNPIHEAVQKEGDMNWLGVLSAIKKACKELDTPIIVKEVGSGISASLAEKLESVGVAAIDVSGSGGTSWSGGVESYRKGRPETELFWDWGIPTSIAVANAAKRVKIPLIASGGIRNGLEVAKAIRLGATLAGAAAPFLKAQNIGGEQEIIKLIQTWKRELKMTCFGTGSKNLSELSGANLIKPLDINEL